MKPGYCPICGGRVGVIPERPSVVAGRDTEPETMLDMRTMREHRCNADDVKAMSRLNDFAARTSTHNED